MQDPSLVYLRPPVRAGAENREPSLYELINAAVADLNVVCVGVNGTRLFFARRAKAAMNDERLAKDIFDRLRAMSQPEAREFVSNLTSIAIQ